MKYRNNKSKCQDQTRSVVLLTQLSSSSLHHLFVLHVSLIKFGNILSHFFSLLKENQKGEFYNFKCFKIKWCRHISPLIFKSYVLN